MLQPHTFAGTRDIAARGSFFLYQSNNAAMIGADERIAVEVDGQPIGDFFAGDSIKLPRGATNWTVRPYAAGLTGTVLIGEGDVRTNRVAGAVSIIQTDALSTLEAKQFWGAPTSSPGASIIRCIGLQAAVATGKSIAVRRLVVSSDTAGDLMIALCQGDPIPAFTPGVGLPNKLAGAANRTEALTLRFNAVGATLASGVDYPTVVPVSTHYAQALLPSEVPLSRPIVLPPGWSLNVSAKVVSRSLTVYFDGEVLG